MFQQINNEFIEITESIVRKTGEMELAREKFLIEKESFEQIFAKSLLETKLRDKKATQIEIEASAKIISYASRLNVITAESRYRRLSNEIRALRDKLESLQEISYNLRREIQIK